VENILTKAADSEGIDREEAMLLMSLELGGREMYALMETANELSRSHFHLKGENHLHIGIDVAPCPMNCSFCSLSKKAGVFKETIEFSPEKIVEWARYAESNAADALNIMTTGTYSFEKLLDAGKLLKEHVSVPLVANTRDFNQKEGEKLLKAGFVGAYHALRLGEGRDTPIPRERRIQTIQAIKDVGLLWMNCIEPVGPEHKPEEMVDLMFLARKYKAAYTGAMRRINFPGSPMEKFGMISEFELARINAVSRLVMGGIPRAHCTHEPHTISLLAGVNLFFPEVGSSPRDSLEDTGKGRGIDIEACRRMFIETGWNPDLTSNCFVPAE